MTENTERKKHKIKSTVSDIGFSQPGVSHGIDGKYLCKKMTSTHVSYRL